MSAEALEELPGPYEILEMTDREVRTIRIAGWQLGYMNIKTSEEPEGKMIKALRIFVPAQTKPVGLSWYDITSQTLIAQLLPFLEQPNFGNKTFVITKYGVAPKARFTVEVK
jgi:hypothetical protein